MPESPEYSARLQCNGFIDVTKRAKGGSFVYLALWLVISIISDLHHSHLTLLTVNALIFLCNGILRYAHARIPVEIAEKYCRHLLRSFEILVLCNIFHWGMLTAYVFYDAQLSPIRLPMLLAGTGIVAAGSLVYSINPVIRPIFATLAIVPVVFVLLSVHYSPDNALIAALCIVFAAYLSLASRTIYNDYWTAQRRALELEGLSFTDSLTQLRNRPFFDNHYMAEWKRACRYGKPVSVLLIDLDHFKRVNDNYGHAFGDLCLKEAARVMLQNIQRPEDVLARYGGEEFIVMLAETDWRGATVVGQHILESFRELKIFKAGQAVNLRCSIGIASLVPLAQGQGDELINMADKALYEAKAAGRDCLKVFMQTASPALSGKDSTVQKPGTGAVKRDSQF